MAAAPAAGTVEDIHFDKAVVTLPGGRTAMFATPVPLAQIAREPELQPTADTGPLLGIRVNGLVMSLNKKLIPHTAAVEPVFFESSEGRSMYRRTLVFVLGMAAAQEFGRDWLVVVEHHVHGGYKVGVNGGATVSDVELRRLDERMRAIVARGFCITERVVGYDEALRYFASHNRPFSHALVETANSDKIRLFNCEGHLSPYLRPLCPSTGVLRDFHLLRVPEKPGFVLLFPPKQPRTPMLDSAQYVEDPILSEVYREYHDWGRLLAVECVGHVNQRIRQNEAKEFVAMSEALHQQKVVEIALDVRRRGPATKLVLIAGPSASGKTTFSAKLSLQLRILGFIPVVLSVDNYYRPRKECPRDETGEYDFETVDALRLDLLNEHLTLLLRGEAVDTPIFDFHTGLPKERDFIKLKLPKNGVLVMEGINTLNDRLTSAVPRENKYKIFLAPLSQLKLDECNFPSQSVDRLIRRINRDYNHRGYSATATISRWASVTASEERNIMPFLKSADVVFNSSLNYEACVLKTYVLPLLKGVKPGSPQYNDARTLMEVLECFYTIPHDFVPPTSLLREFIGGSFFEVQ